MTLQEEIAFQEYFRCYAIGARYVRIMRYDPRVPFHERYVRSPQPIEPGLLERLHADCLKLTAALGYDFDTLEFAVRDGVPYAIDFLNPSPDADPGSVGQENFEWVLEHAAKWLVERVLASAEPPARTHWLEFLAPRAPAKKASTRKPRTARTSGGRASPVPPREA
jgi:hypothetical protein